MTVHFQLFRAAVFAGAMSHVSAVAMADTDFVLTRDLDTRSELTCTSETAFGNLIGDALKKTHDADIGLVNCTIIRGNRTYAAGTTFTPTDVAAEILADQLVAIVEVDGAQLLDSLEHAVATLPAASPAFLQVAGLRMDVDLTKPAGTRIVKLTVNGAALDFARTYKIATTAALAEGAEGYVQFKAAKRVEVPKAGIAQTVSDHLQKIGVKNVKVLGRIEVTR